MTTLQAISPGISRKDVTHDYKKAEGTASDNAASYNNRGLDFMAKGELDSAIDNFDKTIKLDPASPIAHYNRGIAYWYKREFDRAIQNYDKALVLDPYFALAYSNRGLTYKDKGEFDRAIEDYDKALALDPNYVSAYISRGVAFLDKDDLNRAIEDCDKALRLDPCYALAYNNRGITWLGLSKWEKAMSDLTTAKNKKADIVAFFHEDSKSVADFEEKMNVQVPEDIAEMLEPITEEEDAALSQAISEGLDTEPVSKQSVLNLLRDMDEG